jgi:preprotein translocase subunit YajC
MEALVLLAVTFLLMWVLFIFPQQRRLKAHQALVARLEVGDEVMATSGLFGTITELDDEVVHLEVAPGTVVRLARGAIATRVGDEPVVEVDEDAADDATVEVPSSTAADRAVEPAGGRRRRGPLRRPVPDAVADVEEA